MTDKLEREFLSSVQRRIPSWAIALIIVTAVIILFAVLLYPLIRSAHEWRETKDDFTPTGSAGFTINADMKVAEYAERAALTPAQTLVARQSAYISLQYTDANGEVRTSLGNGFVYDDGLVITQEHVIANRTPESILTVNCNNKDVSAKVARVSFPLDVALLAAPGCHGSRLRLAKDPPEDGQRLIATGFRFWIEDEYTEEEQQLNPQSATQYVLMTRYSHRRVADMRTVLQPALISAIERIIPSQFAEGKLIRQKLDEIERRGLPRFLAVVGTAVHGQSGSMLLDADGAIVGNYSMSFSPLNRAFYTQAAAIRLVLRGEGVDE